jgi:hypothetical protein
MGRVIDELFLQGKKDLKALIEGVEGACLKCISS